MGRTGEEKGGGLRQGDEGKKIYNLADNERKIILCRNWRRKREREKRRLCFHLASLVRNTCFLRDISTSLQEQPALITPSIFNVLTAVRTRILWITNILIGREVDIFYIILHLKNPLQGNTRTACYSRIFWGKIQRQSKSDMLPLCRARILVPQTYHIGSAKLPFRCNAWVCLSVWFSSIILPVYYAMLKYQSHTFPHTSGGCIQKLKLYFPFMHIRSDILVPSISFNGRVR